MNNFMVNVLVDDINYTANVTLDGNLIILSYGDKGMTIAKIDVHAIKIISDNFLEIVVDERVITFDGYNTINIINFFNNFKTYNDSNIKVNPVRTVSVKTPLGLCIIYTVLYILIYRGLIGVSLSDVWGTSNFSSFIGGVLAGGDEYFPTDKLEYMSYAMLLIFFICSNISISKRRNKAVTLLQTRNNCISVGDKSNSISNDDNSNLDTLSKLKELLDAGVITQDDYDRKKEEILKTL